MLFSCSQRLPIKPLIVRNHSQIQLYWPVFVMGSVKRKSFADRWTSNQGVLHVLESLTWSNGIVTETWLLSDAPVSGHAESSNNSAAGDLHPGGRDAQQRRRFTKRIRLYSEEDIGSKGAVWRLHSLTWMQGTPENPGEVFERWALLKHALHESATPPSLASEAVVPGAGQSSGTDNDSGHLGPVPSVTAQTVTVPAAGQLHQDLLRATNATIEGLQAALAVQTVAHGEHHVRVPQEDPETGTHCDDVL